MISFCASKAFTVSGSALQSALRFRAQFRNPKFLESASLSACSVRSRTQHKTGVELCNEWIKTTTNESGSIKRNWQVPTFGATRGAVQSVAETSEHQISQRAREVHEKAIFAPAFLSAIQLRAVHYSSGGVHLDDDPPDNRPHPNHEQDNGGIPDDPEEDDYEGPDDADEEDVDVVELDEDEDEQDDHVFIEDPNAQNDMDEEEGDSDVDEESENDDSMDSDEDSEIVPDDADGDADGNLDEFEDDSGSSSDNSGDGPDDGLFSLFTTSK